MKQKLIDLYTNHKKLTLIIIITILVLTILAKPLGNLFLNQFNFLGFNAGSGVYSSGDSSNTSTTNDYVGGNHVSNNDCGFMNLPKDIEYESIEDFIFQRGIFLEGGDLSAYCKRGKPDLSTGLEEMRKNLKENDKNYFPGYQFKWTCNLDNKISNCATNLLPEYPVCESFDYLSWDKRQDNNMCKVGELTDGPVEVTMSNIKNIWKWNCSIKPDPALELKTGSVTCNYCGKDFYSKPQVLEKLESIEEILNFNNPVQNRLDEIEKMITKMVAEKNTPDEFFNLVNERSILENFANQIHTNHGQFLEELLKEECIDVNKAEQIINLINENVENYIKGPNTI